MPCFLCVRFIEIIPTLRNECRWRGSVYKIIYLDMLTFCVIYTLLNVTYRFFLSEQAQKYRRFESCSVISFFHFLSFFIPISPFFCYLIRLSIHLQMSNHPAVQLPRSHRVITYITSAWNNSFCRLQLRNLSFDHHFRSSIEFWTFSS